VRGVPILRDEDEPEATSESADRQSGEGRFDVQLEPKAKTFPGILMEFKAASASDKEKLPGLAEEALQQIEDRSYKTEMQNRGINNIVCYGIAFAGKDALVKLKDSVNSFV